VDTFSVQIINDFPNRTARLNMCSASSFLQALCPTPDFPSSFKASLQVHHQMSGIKGARNKLDLLSFSVATHTMRKPFV